MRFILSEEQVFGGKLFDIEKLAKKEKKKKPNWHVKKHLYLRIYQYFCLKMSKCFANSITLGSEHEEVLP